jgi:hypothetical protein
VPTEFQLVNNERYRRKPVGPGSDITSKSGFFAILFEYNRKLRRFPRRNAGGIWIKIHLNPKTVISAFIIGSIQVMFPKKNLQN